MRFSRIWINQASRSSTMANSSSQQGSAEKEKIKKLKKNNYRLMLGLFIATSLLILAISFALPDDAFYTLLKTALKDIGMSVFIASTVTTAFSEYYRSNREDLSQKELAIYAERVEQLLDKQKESIESPIHKNLEESGVLDFYPTRKGKATDDLRQKLKNVDEGTILLMGASLRVFFHPGSDFTGTINYIIRNKPKVRFQVLLLNPNSPEAIYRSQAETKTMFTSDSEYHEKSMQYNDQVATRKQIIILNGLVKDYKPIDVRFYDAAPYCFLVIFEDECLVSQYIYGDDSTQINTLELPLIKYKSASTAYKRLNWHFNYVWKQSFSDQEMLKESRKTRFPNTSSKGN